MKKLFFMVALIFAVVFVNAQKKEASFTIGDFSDTTLTLYKDIGPLYGGCFTVGIQYYPISLDDDGDSAWVNLYVSIDGVNYEATSNVFGLDTTVTTDSIFWDTLCYPYYRIFIDTIGAGLSGGYLRTTLYFIRMD